MFLLFKMLVIFLLIDHVIYNYYKNKYNITDTDDLQKYRLIAYGSLWILIFLLLITNIINTDCYYAYLYVSLLTLLVGIMMNCYNKKNIKYYPLEFICANIIYTVILANLLTCAVTFYKTFI